MDKRKQIKRMMINDVIKQAKETILRFGEHLPTLIVAGTKDHIVLALEGSPGNTLDERTNTFLNLGTKTAYFKPVGQLQNVFHISEGWAGRPKGGKLPYVRPSQDPHRQEILVIIELDMSTGKQQSAVFEIVRDKAGKLVLMQPFTVEGEDAQSLEVYTPLLPAFVKGYSVIYRT